MITTYPTTESQLVESLALTRRPVAITFLDAIPENIPAFTGAMPSGCSFWKLAAEGRTFYTVPSDHYNCPIGAHTHNIPLPPDRTHELPDTLGLMAQIGYIKMEEVPTIPQLPRTPAAIVYAPLSDTPTDPDLVLIPARPGRAVLLEEAALAAGLPAPAPLLGRPTCMALPAALANGLTLSTGCIGNRIYTGLTDEELYLVVPAATLTQLTTHLQTILEANNKLTAYHQSRQQTLTILKN